MMRAGSLLALLICSSLLVFGRESQAQGDVNYFELSNDGSLVAFSSGGTVGLFDWRVGDLKTIPLPAGVRAMGGPSFATDGKSLAAAVDSEAGSIALFDLATLQMTALHKSDCWQKSRAVFQPGDGAVLFSTGSFPVYLCLYDFEKRTTSRVFPEQDGFSSILSPNFVDRDTVLFAGVNPENSAVAAAVERLGARKVTASIPYRLRLGGVPEIVYPELVRRGMALSAGVGGGPMSFAASRNGERTVFIDRSLSEEDRVKKHPSGPFHYDLFVIEAGGIRQVTHVEAFLSRQAISYDGTIAAFGTYAIPPAAPRVVEVSIVDLRTGVVTRTGLVDRVIADPRFHPRSK